MLHSENLRSLSALVIVILVFVVGYALSQRYGAPDQASSVSSLNAKEVEYVVSEMGKCLGDKGSSCYKAVSQDLFSRFELPVILEIFEQNEDKREIFSRCHQASHYLGRLEFMRTESVPEAFQNATEVCHGGAYHGIIEGYFDYRDIPMGNLELLKTEIKSVCGKQSDYGKPTLYSECVHGIGHAMMFVTEGELHPSLLACDSLASRSDQTTCYGGVFMENSSSSTNQDHPSKYLKANDPLYPCNALEERYQETCYSYQSSHFALLSGHDWTKVIELCRLVPEDYHKGCFKIIGSNQVGFTQDMSVRKGNCGLIEEALYRNHCFSGVVDGLVGRYHHDFPLVISFCSLLIEEDKEACYRNVGQAMRGWVKEPVELERLCRSIKTERYANACLGAGGA